MESKKAGWFITIRPLNFRLSAADPHQLRERKNWLPVVVFTVYGLAAPGTSIYPLPGVPLDWSVPE